jgi:lysozyme family protein
VLTHEGGYTNHPADKGGPTNFGITIHDYRKYVNPRGTARDVRDMPLSTAKKIYRSKYWDIQRCDDLPAGIDYLIFDYGVHSGIGRSGKVLRRLVGISDSTHTITDQVIAATAKRDPIMLIDAICNERMRYLKKLSNWSVFGRGWARRVNETRANARAMAMGQGLSEQTSGFEGSARSKSDNPVAKYVTAALAAGTAGALTVYGWVIENPLYAALIVQGAIALAIMVVHNREEAAKPLPVPEAFNVEQDPLTPHISDEPSRVDTLEPVEVESVIVPPAPEPHPMAEELGAPISRMQTLISSEAKTLKKPGD